MPQVIGYEARTLFSSAVKAQRRLVEDQSPEFTLLFIQEAFKALADGKCDLQIKDQSLRVSDLSASEVSSLCSLSKKFFKKQKDLSVSGELLSHIEKVKHNKNYTASYVGDIDNIRSLNTIKELVYLNEMPETESGSCENLQKELRDEIKKHAITLKKMRRAAQFKRAAYFAAGVAGVIGSTIGFIALAATGAVGGGIALFLVGCLASIGISIAGTEMVKRKVARAQHAQDERIWAFELLKDANAFQTYCQHHSLDPQSITVEELLKHRYLKVESAKEE
jgi:hypothetical protein